MLQAGWWFFSWKNKKHMLTFKKINNNLAVLFSLLILNTGIKKGRGWEGRGEDSSQKQCKGTLYQVSYIWEAWHLVGAMKQWWSKLLVAAA